MCHLPAVLPFWQVGEEVLGTAAKVEVSKESTTIVGDGSSEVRAKNSLYHEHHKVVFS